MFPRLIACLTLVPLIALGGGLGDILTPSSVDARVEQQLGIGQYGAGTQARAMDEQTLRQMGLGGNDQGGSSGPPPLPAPYSGGGAGGSQAGGSQASDATASASAQAYTAAMAARIGRNGDIFVFCYEGGDGGASAQGWYPVSPATGTYVITRYCSGSPCPNWNTLSAYTSLCPQAVGMGTWSGPGGAGAVGQYQATGGSKFKGEAQSPVGLSPAPH